MLHGCVVSSIFEMALYVILTRSLQIHARLGEVLFMSAASSVETNVIKTLSESLRRFCRSIELCDGYLRGYYGLKLVGFMISVIVWS